MNGFAQTERGELMRLIDINSFIRMLNTIDRYTSEELTLCDTNKTFPKNEVFVVDDVYEGLDELPTIESEIIRCKDCKFNSGSKKCLHPDSFFLVPADNDFCSYAERRVEEE